MTEIDLAGLYRDSLVDNSPALKYLTDERNIQDADLIRQVGFLPKVEYRGKTVYDVMVIPVFDVMGRLTILECRALYNKQYFKLTHTRTRIPLYMDFNKVWQDRDKKPLILVEGAIEVMSLKTKSKELLVASTLRASSSKAQLHLLKYYSDNMVVIYNSDTAGINNAEKITNFYKEKYGINVSVEEIPDGYNDLNEMLVRDERGFDDYISYLESEYL